MEKQILCFQSLAGSQKACESFGISKEILDEANEMFLKDGSAKGENVSILRPVKVPSFPHHLTMNMIRE